MANDDKLKGLKVPQEFIDQEQAGAGKIEFDELGNPVWVPFGGGTKEEVIARLLNEDKFSLQQDPKGGTLDRIQSNPVGLKKGYDPYDSGLLNKDKFKKKRNMRELSKWIETRKKLGLSTKED
jgi:hypothetical protein